MRPKLPKASVVKDTPGVQTLWLVQWPSTMTKWGKSYYATTYPNSELIFLETAAKRRPVSKLVAALIHEQVRAAIQRATTT